MTQATTKRWLEVFMWLCLVGAVLALCLVGAGCGAPEADPAPEYPPEFQGEVPLGELEQPWQIFNYRPTRLYGTNPGATFNQRCTPTQASSRECYYVWRNNVMDSKPWTYKVYLNEASFGIGWGPYVRDAFNVALGRFGNTAFKLTEGGVQYPAASIISTNTTAGAQCRISYIDMANSSSNDLAASTLIEFQNTEVVPDFKYPGPVDMPGTWKRGEYADIRLDNLNLSSIPGATDAQAFTQAIISGIFGCIGMGRQSAVSTSYTYNFVQSSVYNMADAWGTSNCEEQHTWKYQHISEKISPDFIDFHASPAGACSL